MKKYSKKIKLLENDRLEFKSDFPQNRNKLKAEIVAFLNTNGGTILLGVDDEGNVLEEKFSLYKKWEEKISQWIINAFSPSVENLITIFPNEKPFRIVVKEGKQKPYFYKDKNTFNLQGIAIRVGSSSKKVDYHELLNIIRKSEEESFENLISPNQVLSFKYLKNFILRKPKSSLMKQEWDNNKILNLKNLKMIDSQKNFNNLALLFSDQNPFYSQFTYWELENKGDLIKKHKEVLTGSIIKQIENLFLLLNKFDFFKKYPYTILIEALLNMFGHNNWRVKSPVKIDVFDNRIEFSNYGNIEGNLTVEEIFDGFGILRNPLLMGVFEGVNLIDNSFSGLRKIKNLYKFIEVKNTKSTFKIIFHLEEKGL